MEVSPLAWGLTIGITVAVLIFDVVMIARNPHEPSMKECTIAFIVYMSGAAVFGLWILYNYGHSHGVDYYTGFLVEKSLSVDNLFVFIVLMSALKVPRKYQQEALMVGIILALIFRGIFIALGYALISNFSWIFYVFGAFLVYTAVNLVRSYRAHEEEHPEDGKVIAFARKRLNVSEEWRGLTLFWKENGHRVVSPMLIVIIALGTTDILFALDSIPAIFGITQEPYLVFTANVFALMGLRQLYFLLGGLLKRLVYLSLGLSFILAFIGVKLVIHALHVNELSFINGGEPVLDWEVPTLMSLGVIIVTLTVTAIASLIKDKHDRERGEGEDDLRKVATPAPTDPAERS